MTIQLVERRYNLIKHAPIELARFKIFFWITSIISFAWIFDAARNTGTLGDGKTLVELLLIGGNMVMAYGVFAGRTGNPLWPFVWLSDYLRRNIVGRTAIFVYDKNTDTPTIFVAGRRWELEADKVKKLPDSDICAVLPLGGWFRRRAGRICQYTFTPIADCSWVNGSYCWWHETSIVLHDKENRMRVKDYEAIAAIRSFVEKYQELEHRQTMPEEFWRDKFSFGALLEAARSSKK